MARFASNTQIGVDRSRSEIERILTRYGADQFGYMTTNDMAMIGFRYKNRMVQFKLPMPDRNADEFILTEKARQRRHPDDALRAWEQGKRQRWRALALCIQAKLEAVESEITTFEQEFLAHIVVPGQGGLTIGEILAPRIEKAHEGETVNLIPWEGRKHG